jgi:hypothetical protein
MLRAIPYNFRIIRFNEPNKFRGIYCGEVIMWFDGYPGFLCEIVDDKRILPPTESEIVSLWGFILANVLNRY